MEYWCGMVDIKTQILSGLFLLLLPFIMIYLAGLYVYCKLKGKVFLEKEARELEEARNTPPIILGGKG